MNGANEQHPDDFVLVLSLGGSPQPLIASIKHHKPRRAIFIASLDTRQKAREILAEADCLVDHDIITLSNYQDLLACVRDMRAELPKALKNMNLPPDSLLVADITGGTKVMSAALTLAMMEYKSAFTYVGGNARSKNGTGTVLDGHETILSMDNPWDVMGLREAKILAWSFNAGQFAAAREQADFLKTRGSGYSDFYEALGTVIDAFRNWDAFNYSAAANLFQQGLGKLRYYNNPSHEKFCPLYGELERAQEALQAINREAAILRGKFQRLDPGFGRAYLRDLAGNARRAARAGHYDDAVARLYSLIEKTVKIALAQMGLNNSRMRKEELAKAGNGLLEKHANEPDGEIKLPLTDSFRALCGLAPENPVALAYRENEAELANALGSRNMSLLAHGYNPVSEQDYQKLNAVALRFLGLSEADLLDFPTFDIKNILF